jgi:hypothetical protein
MPGSARTNPSTTRLSEGETEMTRSRRRIRSARRTLKVCAPGTSEMPTMTKSKMFQPERKKRGAARRA